MPIHSKLQAWRTIKLQKVIKTLRQHHRDEWLCYPRCDAFTRWMSITKRDFHEYHLTIGKAWEKREKENVIGGKDFSFKKIYITGSCRFFPRLTRLFNDFVISLSIVFTCLLAVIAIERDWWWFSGCLLGRSNMRKKRRKLMAFFSRRFTEGKVWHRTIDESGQIVTL